MDIFICVLCFRISHRLQSSCYLDCSHSKDQLWKDLLPRSRTWLGHYSVFHGPQSLLAIGWRLPSVPFHMGFSIMYLTTWQLALSNKQTIRDTERKSMSKIDLYNMVVVFVTWSQKWHPVTFTIFCSLEVIN